MIRAMDRKILVSHEKRHLGRADKRGFDYRGIKVEGIRFRTLETRQTQGTDFRI